MRRKSLLITLDLSVFTTWLSVSVGVTGWEKIIIDADVVSKFDAIQFSILHSEKTGGSWTKIFERDVGDVLVYMEHARAPRGIVLRFCEKLDEYLTRNERVYSWFAFNFESGIVG